MECKFLKNTDASGCFVEVCSLQENYTRYYTIVKKDAETGSPNRKCIHDPPSSKYVIHALDVGRNYAVVKHYNVTGDQASKTIAIIIMPILIYLFLHV